MQEFCQVNIKHKYFQSSFLELKLVQPYGVCIGMPLFPLSFWDCWPVSTKLDRAPDSDMTIHG